MNYVEKGTYKPNIYVCPADMSLDDAFASSEELTANISNPLLSALSLVTGYELGESDEYLVSIINGKDVDKLEYGESVCIFSPLVQVRQM